LRGPDKTQRPLHGAKVLAMSHFETNGRGEKMIGSMRVESVSVPVSDHERTKGFYVDTLGFELLVDYTWREDMRWSEVALRALPPR